MISAFVTLGQELLLVTEWSRSSVPNDSLDRTRGADNLGSGASTAFNVLFPGLAQLLPPGHSRSPGLRAACYLKAAEAATSGWYERGPDTYLYHNQQHHSMAIAGSNRSHRRSGSESDGANSQSKAALIERLRQGDVAAFDAFIRERWPRLFCYLLDRVRMRDVAEDIAQEALARLWERRRTLDASSSAVAWLYQTARNLAVDELRKIEVRRRWRDTHPEVESTSPPTPLQVTETHDLLEAFRRALEGLPDRRREAFTLVHIHHLSIHDAAEVMGNAPQTVANQVAAAVGELRRTLRPYLD